MIGDRNIKWLRKKRVFQWREADIINTVGPTTASLMSGTATGAPIAGEVVDGFGGMQVSTANDELGFWDFKTPGEFDPSQEIGVRIFYTCVGAPTALDAVTWKVLYKQLDPGETIGDPATALDTVITAQACGGTAEKQLMLSSRGIINANKFDYTARKGAFMWMAESDAITTYTATQLHLLALVIDYMPLLCVNSEEGVDVFKNVAAIAQ